MVQGKGKVILMVTNNWIQSPDSERAASKLVMPMTHRNEKAGQSASSTLVHRSTSQRWTEEFWCFITRYLLAV